MSEDFPRAPGGFAAGSRIAGYLLEEQIGQGGMAVVFRAHDERLDRTVALKILAPALADDQAFRQRFIRESRAAAAVDDPHIIPVFEAGEASGVLFIAMRYVRGGDARSLLSSTGTLPVGRVAEMMSQVASALDAAHARGLVHRDVKPANMLLDASGGTGRPDHVYLSDFGLSKAALQSSGLTGTGTFLGTLDYVAPEQIEGKPVDGRADQYALACAAFELLAGMPPFARPEAMAVMYAQLSEQPPSLSARRHDLPGAVDAVFYRALAKAPADRYANCREFAEALRKACGLRPYDSGPGVIPGPDHPVTQVAWPGDRTKRPPGAGGAGLTSGEQAGTVLAGTASGGGTAQPSDPGTVQAGGPGTVQAGGPGTADSGPATQAVPPVRGTSPDLTSVQLRGPLDGYQGQRPRWRSPGMLAAALVIVVVLGAGGAYATLHGKGHGRTGGGGGHHVTVLTAPGCSQTAAAASTRSVAQTTYPVPNGKPFGVAVSPDSRYVLTTTAHTLESYITSQGLTLAHRFSFPIPGTMPAGMTITPNGQDLLVAAGDGIDVLSLEAAETGTGNLLLGQLTVPGVSGFGRAIGVAVTPNGQFAFVTLQFRGEVAVFNLGDALANGGFNPNTFVGAVPLGGQPVGLAVSPDGTRLYVTSFASQDTPPQEGVLAALDVAQLEVHPAQASITRVAAGCSPARIVVSPDNKTVWVTARDSDFLLGLSAALLGSDPHAALIAKVQVGKSPIGLALVNRGTKILVADADSNRTNANNLAVVNVAKALAGQPGALIGYLPSGLVPHEITITHNHKFAIVSDLGSGELQVVNLRALP